METNNIKIFFKNTRNKGILTKKIFTERFHNVYPKRAGLMVASCFGDWLANQGAAHSFNLVILDSVPVELIRILEEDIQGVARPRLVHS